MLKSNMRKELSDVFCKTIIVGQSGVGKTNILLRFTESQFKYNHATTIGVDFKTKLINVEGTRIKLQIWDTAGQCRFRNINRILFQGALGAIFVYSVGDEKSFKNIGSWIKQANEESDYQGQIRILLANKCDLPQGERKVSTKQGQEFAEKHGMEFLEVSAKDGIGINQSFELLGTKLKKNKVLLEKIEKKKKDPRSQILPDEQPKKRRKRCCS